MAFGVETLDIFTGGQLFHTDVVGCMDKNNLNYDPAATINDGDRCGGCRQGFTRIGESSFTCQEVSGKYIDCKTGEVYWKLKKGFAYHPPKDAANCSWYNYGQQCFKITVLALKNNGIPYITKMNAKHTKWLDTWNKQRKLMESVCGGIAEIPVASADVPNYLGPSASIKPEDIPASTPPPNLTAQNTSTTLNNTTDTTTINTMSGGVQPVAQPAATNWPLIIGVAVGAYFLSNQL